MPYHPYTGIVLLLAAVACFAMMDTVIRHATGFASVVLILWLRYAVQAAVMTLALIALRPAALRTRHPRFQLTRGLLLLATSGIATWALKFVPVAEFTAVFMVSPVIVTLAAVWLFKESVPGAHWLLMAGMFAGMLLIVRPGGALFGPAIVWPLLGALVYAGFQLLTRVMATQESAFTTHLYTGVIGTIAMTPLLWAFPGGPAALTAPLEGAEWRSLFAIGLIGTVGHLLLVLAFARAPASTLMPFVYAQIGFATLGGWIGFGHVPDGPSLAGMAVIAACGAAVMWLKAGSAPSSLRDRVRGGAVR